MEVTRSEAAIMAISAMAMAIATEPISQTGFPGNVKNNAKPAINKARTNTLMKRFNRLSIVTPC